MAPILPIHEFNHRELKEVFVNRENILKVIEDGLIEDRALSLFNIYGLGGMGKSQILNQVQKKIELHNVSDKRVAFAKVDFAFNDISPIKNYLEIIGDLEKFGFEFPCFCFALIDYYTSIGNKEMAKNVVDQRFNRYDDYQDYVGMMLEAIYDGFGPLKILVRLGSFLDKYSSSQMEYIKEFFSTYKSIPKEEKIERLGTALYLDLVNSELHWGRKVFFLFDSYEKFYDGNYVRFMRADKWIFNFISSFSKEISIKPVFIIAGRDRIPLNTLKKYLDDIKVIQLPEVKGLDFKFCVEYLNKCKIPVEFQDIVYSETKGYPFSLYMLVLHYHQLKKNTTVTEADLKLTADDYNELYQKVIDYLPRDVSRVLESLAYCTWFDRTILKGVAEKHFIAWSEQDYHDITSYAFCREVQEGKFILQRDLKNILRLNYLHNYSSQFPSQQHQTLFNILQKYLEDTDADDDMSLRIDILRQLCYQGILSGNKTQIVCQYFESLINDYDDVYFVSDLIVKSLINKKILYKTVEDIIKQHIQTFPLTKFHRLVDCLNSDLKNKPYMIIDLVKCYFDNNYILCNEIKSKSIGRYANSLEILKKYIYLNTFLSQVTKKDYIEMIQRRKGGKLTGAISLLNTFNKSEHFTDEVIKVTEAILCIESHSLLTKFDTNEINKIKKLMQLFDRINSNYSTKFRNKLSTELTQKEILELRLHGLNV